MTDNALPTSKVIEVSNPVCTVGVVGDRIIYDQSIMLANVIGSIACRGIARGCPVSFRRMGVDDERGIYR